MRTTFLPYCRPFIDDDDIELVVDSLRRGWLTTGPKTKKFEETFAAMSGVKHAIGLNSCTAGLHLGLIALGVGPGDEVVMPSLTFVAGAQCARQIGATPVFCDVDLRTLCVNVETVDKVVTKRTKVIMPMHYGGRPVHVAEIVAYAEARGIRVLEDAAHALGTLDRGLWAGAVSDGAVYSFYPTKNITTAEGGVFITNDDAVAERVRVLSLHGMDRDAWKRYNQGGTWRYDVVATGYKYNMPDLSASLGLTQLGKLTNLQTRRDEIATRYLDALGGIPGVKPASQYMQHPDRHSWCMFAVLLDAEQAGITRDDLIAELARANIGTSVHYIPTHLFSAYRSTLHAPLPATDSLWQRLLSLPLYPGMSATDAGDVIDALGFIVERSRRPQRRRVGSAP